MRVASLLLVASMAGCTGVAGIADLRTGDLGDGGADAEGGASADGATSADADAEPPLPQCPGGQLALRVTVVSIVGDFTGVSVAANNGNGTATQAAPYAQCLEAGTQVQLQAIPDDSNGNHIWAGTTCAQGRRCQFDLNQPTSVDAHLQ